MDDEILLTTGDAVSRDRRLNAVIAGYLQARDEGRPFDRRSLLAERPDLANELNRFFESDDRVEWLVTSVVPAVAADGAWFGPYRIVRMISRGGMGVVYETEDPVAARRVALKVLSTLGLPDPRDQERFRREIELASRLEHPGIVRILDWGTSAGLPYCTMDLIEGRDLRTMIRSLRSARPIGSVERAVVPSSPPGAVSVGTIADHCRFVARVGAQAAGALAHAHSQEIWHRDIKPSNLLLDAEGNIHVTDFGLAKAAEKSDLTETGDLAGTLRYLAPERLEGWCGPWSDVYSLGLTLYELLTLRPAFENLDRSRLIRAIARESPRRPRAVDPAIARDLETIIRRAIEKEPGHRYPTAAALAADLERFLAGRPILGRPIGPWRRAWGWARRNPATAGALVAAGLVLAIGVTGTLFGMLMSREAAVARANEAETARRGSRYQSLTLQLQQIRLLPHASGWSERAWDLVRQAAAIRADAPLRDQAAATLAGIDARLVKRLDGIGASSLAFDRDGKRLLIGGLEPDEHRDGRAGILDLTGDRPPVICGLSGPGPVLFRDDGTPLQLTVQAGRRLVLWDLDRRRAVAQFELPGDATPEGLALGPNGSSVAAPVTTAQGPGRVLVWDVEPRRLRHQFDGKATALAFSDDGTLLAGGDDDGRIRVWSRSGGELMFDQVQGRNTIHCFSFTRNPRRDRDGNRGWLLAAGDSGGLIAVWDLATQLPISRCHGSAFNVYAVSFSPDGMTLASAGRMNNTTLLWDWASGRTILSCAAGLSLNSGLAFSRDGRGLATGHHFLHDAEFSHVYVSEMSEGRGSQILRGLTAPVASVLFSPDGRKVAALSHDWQIAVWDLAAGRLDAILSAPKGFVADHAGVAFSGDGRRLAACSGREARLWDLALWKEIQSWPLPPGLFDRIVFSSSGQLLVFRCETLDRMHMPLGTDFRVHPRVCRIRDLLRPLALTPLAEFREFNREIHDAVAILDGTAFIVAGWRDSDDDRYRAIKALNSLTASERWSIRSESGVNDVATPALAVSRQHVYIGTSSGGAEVTTSVRDVTTGAELSIVGDWPGKPSPDRSHFVRVDQQQSEVRLRGEQGLHLSLGIDRSVCSARAAAFSPNGKILAWGHADGSVMVADLEEIRSRLAGAGLGWGSPISSRPSGHSPAKSPYQFPAEPGRTVRGPMP